MDIATQQGRRYDKLMTETAAKLQKDVDGARAAYAAAEQRLAELCAGPFVDGPEAARELLERADELGPVEAVSALGADPERFGPLTRETSASDVTQHGREFEAALETALDARDALDKAVSGREAPLRQAQPEKPQVLVFGGREYVVDTRRGELRSVDNPDERYRLVDEPERSQPAPGPTQSVPDELKAKPRAPERGPGRGR